MASDGLNYDKVSDEPASSSHASRQGRAELRSSRNNTMLGYMSTEPMGSTTNLGFSSRDRVQNRLDCARLNSQKPLGKNSTS
ncbi:hypothetical protein WJX75_009038 [Coccomyxa subellipsoidea]|uniref:Uncharacterized protein n=1 Tax=Coccomyxa subellipsoidea TaxID=248742 RepID=A0ABR2YDC8_9CHLO